MEKDNTGVHNSKDSKDFMDFKDFMDSKDFKNNTWSCPYYIYEIKDEFYNSIDDNVKIKKQRLNYQNLYLYKGFNININ